jgi:hypothetical protein
LDDGFAHRVIDRINNIEGNNTKQNVLSLFPILISAAACFLFLLVYIDWSDHTLQSEVRAESNFLGNAEKQMIEDLMLFPEELTEADSFLSEETYDLLVLLDN